MMGFVHLLERGDAAVNTSRPSGGPGHIHCCAWLHGSAAVDADCMPLFVAKMCAPPCFSGWSGWACRWGLMFSGPGSSFHLSGTTPASSTVWPLWTTVLMKSSYLLRSWFTYRTSALMPLPQWSRNATFWAVATFKVEQSCAAFKSGGIFKTLTHKSEVGAKLHTENKRSIKLIRWMERETKVGHTWRLDSNKRLFFRAIN